MDTPTWTTRDGDTLEIREMGTSHIRNAIAMLKRNMPDHEENEYEVSDHWSLPGIAVEVGAKHYREKIAEFEAELATRKNHD